MAAIAFHVFVVRAALALPDGDLNRDGHLDAADALLARGIATEGRSPSAPAAAIR